MAAVHVPTAGKVIEGLEKALKGADLAQFKKLMPVLSLLASKEKDIGTDGFVAYANFLAGRLDDLSDDFARAALTPSDRMAGWMTGSVAPVRLLNTWRAKEGVVFDCLLDVALVLASRGGVGSLDYQVWLARSCFAQDRVDLLRAMSAAGVDFKSKDFLMHGAELMSVAANAGAIACLRELHGFGMSLPADFRAIHNSLAPCVAELESMGLELGSCAQELMIFGAKAPDFAVSVLRLSHERGGVDDAYEREQVARYLGSLLNERFARLSLGNLKSLDFVDFSDPLLKAAASLGVYPSFENFSSLSTLDICSSFGSGVDADEAVRRWVQLQLLPMSSWSFDVPAEVEVPSALGLRDVVSDSNGKLRLSALGAACLLSPLDVVESLIASGADVDGVAAASGVSPLAVAAMRGRLDVVKVLLSHGAKADISVPLLARKASGSVVVKVPLAVAVQEKAAWRPLKPGDDNPILQALESGAVRASLEDVFLQSAGVSSASSSPRRGGGLSL